MNWQSQARPAHMWGQQTAVTLRSSWPPTNSVIKSHNAGQWGPFIVFYYIITSVRAHSLWNYFIKGEISTIFIHRQLFHIPRTRGINRNRKYIWRILVKQSRSPGSDQHISTQKQSTRVLRPHFSLPMALVETMPVLGDRRVNPTFFGVIADTYNWALHPTPETASLSKPVIRARRTKRATKLRLMCRFTGWHLNVHAETRGMNIKHRAFSIYVGSELAVEQRKAAGSPPRTQPHKHVRNKGTDKPRWNKVLIYIKCIPPRMGFVHQSPASDLMEPLITFFPIAINPHPV